MTQLDVYKKLATSEYRNSSFFMDVDGGDRYKDIKSKIGQDVIVLPVLCLIGYKMFDLVIFPDNKFFFMAASSDVSPMVEFLKDDLVLGSLLRLL
jgi:hypothetical protein